MKRIFSGPAGRWLRFAIQLCGIALLILTDRQIKNFVAANLKGKDGVVCIPGVLGFVYAENTGAAFSLFSASTQVLSAVTAVALVAGVLALLLIKKKPLIYEICIPLIIAGGAGNLLDRVTWGYVVDYIETLFIDFPVFNFADCLITCSCFAVIIYLIVEIVRDAKKKNATEAPSDG